MTRNEAGRARPPGAPQHPQRKKLPHERPRWLRPEGEIFITICCESRGKNALCHADVAREIFNSVEFRNQNNLSYARLVCLMPDHLHALISFPYERPMKQIISDWKRFLATTLNVEWQRDFFDHRLRKEESYREKADYIRANPLRAGLVTASEEWPYFWQADPQEHNADHEGRAPSAGAPGGRALPVLITLCALAFAACRPDMANQPKAKPLSESDFFSNQANARPIPPHTVERGGARENAAFYTGLTDGTYITQLPVNLTPELLARGRERFDVMCAECHDRTGSGNGMIVQRGFPQPPSYDIPRLRNAPIGHFFDVITNGYGVMYSYATRVEPEDRWAIAAYIRALQLSHNVKALELTRTEQQKLENEQ